MDLRTGIHLLITPDTPSEERDTEKANSLDNVAVVMMAVTILAMVIIYVYIKKSITNESIFDILFDKGNLFEIFVVFFSALMLAVGMFWLLQKVKNHLYEESILVKPEHKGDKSMDYRGLSFFAVALIIALFLFFCLMRLMSMYQYFEYILFGGFFIVILVIILDQRKREKKKRVIEGL